MTTITATAPTSTITRCTFVHRTPLAMSSSSIVGFSAMRKAAGKVRCSVDGKTPSQECESKVGMGASFLAAACAATMSNPAMALVDERLSTEGTGLAFGLSNNLLGWILLGVFGLIWSFYIVYTSGLEEDEESGLSL